MLKKRLVATLIIKNGLVVQSLGFKRYLPVGDPSIAIEFLNSWGIDEIVLLDISASQDHARKDYRFIEKISHSCFVPLTVGGGINSLEDIRALMHYGADKVSVNHHCLQVPEFISEASRVFGNQCIVVSMDVCQTSSSEYRVYDAVRRVPLDKDPYEWAQTVESLGAGEIYLTNVHRDGAKSGFDLELIGKVSQCVNIPIIASGGAGCPGHLLDVLKNTRASAVSAANYFHFSEHSVMIAKSFLRSHGIDIRLDTNATYEKYALMDDQRLDRLSDDDLDNLLFKKIEKEII